jgi:acyl-CoA thioesterase FadM
MSEIGYGPQKAFDDGVVYPVAHLEADYLYPIGLSDTVTISLESDVGTTSVSVEFEGITDDECVFQGNLTAVFIKHVSNETLSVPDPVRTGLSAL